MKRTRLFLTVLLGCVLASLLLAGCPGVTNQRRQQPTTTETNYTVTFDTAGGNYIPSVQVKSGERVTAPRCPEKDGYEFSGWFVGSSKFDFTTKITSDKTLKAKWTSVANSSSERKTITFWHLDTTDEQQAAWREIADNFEEKHPNVTVEITCFENGTFKQRIAQAVQAGNPPDIFRSWGGGTMLDQVEAGMLREITNYVNTGIISTISDGGKGIYSSNGKQYGAPYSLGTVGIWYNKAIFDECGLTEDDFSTWTKFLNSCQIIKNHGYAPVALGAAESWTTQFWWTYLAQRLGGEQDFLDAYNGTGAFNTGTFLTAMNMLKAFVETNPFQDDFLQTYHAEQNALVADKQAAMTLMGQWAPSTGHDNATTAAGRNAVFGYMAFPVVDGGIGLLSDTQGGGDGLVIGKNAPDEAIEFLKSLYTFENYQIICTRLYACPVIPGYNEYINSEMRTIAQAVQDAGYYQLYYDQFLPPAVAEVLKENVLAVITGTKQPQAACDAIQASWEQNR
ncbi:MAG: extracellular solute-binding protein [Treponemataceae bacterium]|nr:extracellular solute-binding protein [Treponemataceae bacterium]